MAEGATARTGRRSCRGAVGAVRRIFPFPVSKLFVVCSETLLLPHDKYGRQASRNEPTVGIQNGLAGRILLYAVALEQNDRAVWKIEHLSGSHQSSGIVAVYLSDLTVLVIVEGIEQMESVMVARRKPNTVYC